MSKVPRPEGRAALFDAYVSTHFERLNEPPGGGAGRLYARELRDVLPADPDAAILEVGVGMGHLAYHLVKERGYGGYTGIDLSRECVEYVRRHVTDRVVQVDDTLAWLVNRRDSFSLILMFDVIEHIPKGEHLPMLEALREALRPRGILVLRTDNMACATGLYQARMDFTHEYTYVDSGLEQVLRLAGFTNVTVRGDRPGVTGIRTALNWALAKLWRAALRGIHSIERPGSRRSVILTKNLYAICRREG